MWGNSMQNDDMHSAGSCMASGQPPDDALILRIAQGDTAALEVLYRQTSSSIYGFALSILRDPVAAEDVMQDTFVSVMQSAPGYQPSGKPMAWLLTIARNLALMRLRRAESKNLSFDELFHVEDTHDAYQTTENHMAHGRRAADRDAARAVRTQAQRNCRPAGYPAGNRYFTL